MVEEVYEGALSLDMGIGPEDEQPDQVTEIPTPRNNIEFYLDEKYELPAQASPAPVQEDVYQPLFDFFSLGQMSTQPLNSPQKPGGFLGVGGNL